MPVDSTSLTEHELEIVEALRAIGDDQRRGAQSGLRRLADRAKKQQTGPFTPESTTNPKAADLVRPVFMRAPSEKAVNVATIPLNAHGFATDFAPGMAVSCRVYPDQGDHFEMLGYYIERRGNVQWVAVPFEVGRVWQPLTTFDEYDDVYLFDRPVAKAVIDKGGDE